MAFSFRGSVECGTEAPPDVHEDAAAGECEHDEDKPDKKEASLHAATGSPSTGV
jgi:hypothetical protein